jgi:NADPH:quinone reductase-like Zn-dependent oxidoreductase
VGGAMLSACCHLVGVEGHVASVTEAPAPDDFERLFEKNASFHPIGANAYMLVEDRRYWARYRAMLEELARMFDAGELAPLPVRNMGPLSADTVTRAHELLEGSAVQGKLVMTCL